MFQVFSATNVELVTKTRTEHLTDADKEKSSPRSPIQSFLNIAEVEEKQNSPSSSEEVSDRDICMSWSYHLLSIVWKCCVNLVYHSARFLMSLGFLKFKPLL